MRIPKTAGPEDYTSVTRTLTFSPSNLREVFAVQIRDDNTDELEEEEFRAVISIEPEEEGSVQLIPERTVIVIRDNDG